MATDRSRGGTFSPVRRKINDEYKPADDDYPMGGTVIPSAITNDDEHSGVRFPVHAEKLEECTLVVEGENGDLKHIPMSARAMEILREGNRDGKKMNYGEAIAMAKAEEEAVGTAQPEAPKEDKTPDLLKVEKTPADIMRAKAAMSAHAPEPEQEPEPPPPDPGPSPTVPVAVGAVTAQEDNSPVMEAQRAEKPKKGRRKKKAAAETPAPVVTPKIPVVFSSELGQMSVLAEKVFVGGPGNICLVIIQYSPEGHFLIPPQSDKPVMVSFNGNVYKCLTGIYYQIPGTPVMHTVYFIAKE